MSRVAIGVLTAVLGSITVAGSATATTPVASAGCGAAAAATTTAAPSTTAAGAATTTTAVPDGWVPYTASDISFSVNFPAEPESQRTPSAGPDGSLLVLVTVSAEVDDRVYQVNSVPIPAGSAVTLEGGRDGSLQQIGATLVSSTPIEVGGRTGLEYVGTLEDGGSTFGRLFCDALNVYQVVVISEEPVEATDPDVAAFLSSFTFLGAAP